MNNDKKKLQIFLIINWKYWKSVINNLENNLIFKFSKREIKLYKLKNRLIIRKIKI